MRDVFGCHEVAGQKRNRISVHLIGGAAVIFEIPCRCDHVGTRLLHGFARVARFKPGQFVGVIGNGVSELREQPATFGRAQASPCSLKRTARGLDRAIYIFCVPCGYLRKLTTFRRCDNGKDAV